MLGFRGLISFDHMGYFNANDSSSVHNVLQVLCTVTLCSSSHGFTLVSKTSILTEWAITCTRRHSTKSAIKFSAMTIVQREFCALRQRQIPVLLSLAIFVVPKLFDSAEKASGQRICGNDQ